MLRTACEFQQTMLDDAEKQTGVWLLTAMPGGLAR